MKFIGRVSLFCIIGVLGFVLGIYANHLFQKWFYPNKSNEPKMQPYTMVADEEKASHTEEDSYLVVNHPEAVISCDTAFMIEEYDKNTENIVMREEEVPEKYMGMNRDSFVEAMLSYEMSPPLEEQKKGLVSVEVLSFSEKRVLIRKNYELEEIISEKIFYLVAEDHYITVYLEDMENIYLYTDINLEELPASLQEEIIHKKLISGEANLYHFLESYSS